MDLVYSIFLCLRRGVREILRIALMISRRAPLAPPLEDGSNFRFTGLSHPLVTRRVTLMLYRGIHRISCSVEAVTMFDRRLLMLRTLKIGLLGGVLFALSGSASFAATYDVANDFSITNNGPLQGNAWSYGWAAYGSIATPGYTFNIDTDNGPNPFGPDIQQWRGDQPPVAGNDGNPSVFNTHFRHACPFWHRWLPSGSGRRVCHHTMDGAHRRNL